MMGQVLVLLLLPDWARVPFAPERSLKPYIYTSPCGIISIKRIDKTPKLGTALISKRAFGGTSISLYNRFQYFPRHRKLASTRYEVRPPTEHHWPICMRSVQLRSIKSMSDRSGRDHLKGVIKSCTIDMENI